MCTACRHLGYRGRFFAGLLPSEQIALIEEGVRVDP